MAKKPGLSLDQHQANGAELRDIDRRLQALVVQFSNAYPNTGAKGRAKHHLSKALDSVGMARCLAEDLLFADFPEATTDVYYGGT